jgi:hypothetical protein
MLSTAILPQFKPAAQAEAFAESASPVYRAADLVIVTQIDNCAAKSTAL